MGINIETRTIFFTKNGKSLGIAFEGVRDKELYPSKLLEPVSKIKHASYWN